MPNPTPLRIVHRDDALPEWLFGERLDDPRLLRGDCRTLAVLQLDDRRFLYLALTDDFDWICDHCDVPLYTDWEHVVVEAISSFERGDEEPAFHPRVSLERLPERSEAAINSDSYADIHKMGGDSYWLDQNPCTEFRFIAQIAFPDSDDLLLDLDWPTGEMTVEILQNTIDHSYCILWRMHA
jgi:hypothetical protein